MSTTTTPILRSTDHREIANLDLRDRVITIEPTPLVVVGGSYGHVDIEDVKSGAAKRIQTNLSQDGRHFGNMWHTAADGEEADWVYVERWTADGRTFHGYVDSVSRKILQSG